MADVVYTTVPTNFLRNMSCFALDEMPALRYKCCLFFYTLFLNLSLAEEIICSSFLWQLKAWRPTLKQSVFIYSKMGKREMFCMMASFNDVSPQLRLSLAIFMNTYDINTLYSQNRVHATLNQVYLTQQYHVHFMNITIFLYKSLTLWLL